MLIDSVTLNNFRVYKGENTIFLSINPEQHVTVISGQNGFGKTSLLTSLVWGLYGKLMADVDERYRKEIYESGGYRKFTEKLISRPALQEANEKKAQLSKQTSNTSDITVKNKSRQELDSLFSFSVTVKLVNIFIPHFSCKEVSIKRTCNVKTGNEVVDVLIDGKINELTKTIGQEIFINDFILPKEIAKFFFFDAEKIVALAEVRNLEEKQYFSKAYNEVLGIKKYTDLLNNLENLRLRIRKKSAKKSDLQKIEGLQAKLLNDQSLLEVHEEELDRKEQEWIIKKASFSNLQEQLVRVGSALSYDELEEFKKIRTHLREDISKCKNKFTDMLELAPFAILARKMEKVKQQLNLEERQQNINLVNNLLQDKYLELKQAFEKELNLNKIQIDNVLKTHLLHEIKSNQKVLLDFTTDQQNQFTAVYDNVKNSYSKHFRNLVADLKRFQSNYNLTQKKVQDAEAKGNDPVIAALKVSSEQLNNEISRLEESILDLKVKKGILAKEMASITKQLSELSKYIKIELFDLHKDETSSRLIKQLEGFVYHLKQKKKSSLEINIKKELNRLMHKSNFITNVEVIIEGDLIDIELFDNQNQIINKDSLSKGEQQLYATALLKALINESNIQFPVFIDSPLQKFDKLHAENIIKDFYPAISGQVVLFPLLEKELNANEYNMLLPKVGKAYLINQVAPYKSAFIDINPTQLFSSYQETQKSNV